MIRVPPKHSLSQVLSSQKIYHFSSESRSIRVILYPCADKQTATRSH